MESFDAVGWRSDGTTFFQTYRPKTHAGLRGGDEQTRRFPSVRDETHAGIAVAISRPVMCGPDKEFASRGAMFLEAVCERSKDLLDAWCQVSWSSV